LAVIEKACAHFRTASNTYASLQGGWSIEANRAFNAAAPQTRAIISSANATAMAQEIWTRWINDEVVCIGFLTVPQGAPLIASHA